MGNISLLSWQALVLVVVTISGAVTNLANDVLLPFEDDEVSYVIIAKVKKLHLTPLTGSCIEILLANERNSYVLLFCVGSFYFW